MSIAFEKLAPRGRGTSFMGLEDFQCEWPEATQFKAPGWPVTTPVSQHPFRSSGHLYGQGYRYSPTQLPFLNFSAEREENGPDGGVFAFSGRGTANSYDTYRRVYLRGTATQTFPIEHTPFLEGFHGHAVVSDDDYTWSVDTTDLYRVTGVVPATPPKRRARYHAPSRAYNAFKELGSWLQMSDEELAPIIKVSRGTVSVSWRNGTEPRKREHVRRLFQLRGVVSALHTALGDDLTVWLKRGSPCPLKLLRTGED